MLALMHLHIHKHTLAHVHRDSRREEGGSSKHRGEHHHHHHHHSHSRGRSAGRHERGSSAAGGSERGTSSHAAGVSSAGASVPLPPPPPLRGSSGRMHMGTPPYKERGDGRAADRNTPGSTSRDQGTPVPSGPLPSNSFLAEVMKHSKQIYYSGKDKERQYERGGSAEDGEAVGEDGDREAGEIEVQQHQEQPGRKRKHSPIVWEPGAPKHSRTTAEGAADASAGGGGISSGGGGGSEDRRGGEGRGSRGRGERAELGGHGLYERTAQEAAEFKRRQLEEEGFDPEAPPAMKPSPSGSEGIASRWLMDADNEEEDEDAAGARRRAGGAAGEEPLASASPPASGEQRRMMEGVGPGGALPTSEAGDYELDSGTSSPGQNKNMNPDHIFMVMEYMDHDLKSLMDDKHQFSRPFSVAESKCLMLQLLSGVHFLHQHWVLHRDIKTSNILYNSKGDLKLCDFGMARQYGDPLQPYTHLVVTLWYRAPELLLGQQLYSTAVDVWSCGCIMAEILTGKPLLMGHGELDQLDKMVQVLGTPTEAEWPGIKHLPNYNKIVLKQVAVKPWYSFRGDACPSEVSAQISCPQLTHKGCCWAT
ncbi:kinase-like domain-containing protein [Dunaliella salina]|uniref:Kinase-like domain-containing protein n=1 Tax=Dunaliella salina TaxID=3046 RepID=A0ABQ7H1M7_DUNSA|nr:kinase-like domain-containing protein [Dunaliella salina]|eukprot:KAF5840758.1 kinase-like domain-containing protein [Dunaliella salina]